MKAYRASSNRDLRAALSRACHAQERPSRASRRAIAVKRREAKAGHRAFPYLSLIGARIGRGSPRGRAPSDTVAGPTRAAYLSQSFGATLVAETHLLPAAERLTTQHGLSCVTRPKAEHARRGALGRASPRAPDRSRCSRVAVRSITTRCAARCALILGRAIAGRAGRPSSTRSRGRSTSSRADPKLPERMPSGARPRWRRPRRDADARRPGARARARRPTWSSFMMRSSAIRLNWKSMAHTWSRRSGSSRLARAADVREP
jgi:hypothetical protein